MFKYDCKNSYADKGGEGWLAIKETMLGWPKSAFGF